MVFLGVLKVLKNRLLTNGWTVSVQFQLKLSTGTDLGYHLILLVEVPSSAHLLHIHLPLVDVADAVC